MAVCGCTYAQGLRGERYVTYSGENLTASTGWCNTSPARTRAAVNISRVFLFPASTTPPSSPPESYEYFPFQIPALVVINFHIVLHISEIATSYLLAQLFEKMCIVILLGLCCQTHVEPVCKVICPVIRQYVISLRR